MRAAVCAGLSSVTDMCDKKVLRKHFSQVREAAKNIDADRQIAVRFLSDSRVLNADCVLLYASFGSECDTFFIAEELLRRSVPVAFPKSEKNGIMTFHTVTSLSQLSEGMYGIKEPDAALPSPVITENSVIAVPGLAFDPDGHRLGYGGGYYDRFLAAYPQTAAIALAFEAQICGELPFLPHDMTVYSVITEERTVPCCAK